MKRYRRVVSHDNEEWSKVWRQKRNLGSKNDMSNLVNFNASSGKSENLQFNVLLLWKVYYVWAKNVQRGMCHNIEEWCKICRRTDLCFEKWQEEFGEFWPSTRKSQNMHFNGLLLTKVYIPLFWYSLFFKNISTHRLEPTKW